MTAGNTTTKKFAINTSDLLSGSQNLNQRSQDTILSQRMCRKTQDSAGNVRSLGKFEELQRRHVTTRRMRTGERRAIAERHSTEVECLKNETGQIDKQSDRQTPHKVMLRSHSAKCREHKLSFTLPWHSPAMKHKKTVANIF